MGDDILAAIDTIDYSVIRIPPEYLDRNGYLGAGYCSVVLDKALDLPWRALGMNYTRIESEGKSSFVLESRYTYLQPVEPGDPAGYDFQLLDHDEKRAHYRMAMRHATDGRVLATVEQMLMCVDIRARRGTSWPADVLERLKAVLARDRLRPRPGINGVRVHF